MYGTAAPNVFVLQMSLCAVLLAAAAVCCCLLSAAAAAPLPLPLLLLCFGRSVLLTLLTLVQVRVVSLVLAFHDETGLVNTMHNL
jgi:hypothetical protein